MVIKKSIPPGPEWSPKHATHVLRNIPINIWDDYHDDGFIPKGEVQEAHAYVESFLLSVELRNDVMREFLGVLKKLAPSKKTSFSLVERGEGELEIAIKHLTHADRMELLRRMKKGKPKYMGVPLDVYSES